MLGVNLFSVSRSYKRGFFILPYRTGKYTIVKHYGKGKNLNDLRGKCCLDVSRNSQK